MGNVKNHTEQGGERTIISGELEITAEGKLTFGGIELRPAEIQIDSIATTIADLKNDFNSLLTKLKAAGIMVEE